MGWMKTPKEVTDDKMGKERMMKEEVVAAVKNGWRMVMVMM